MQSLKEAKAIAAYDAWFRAQIEASIDDDRESISDQDARAAFARRKRITAKEGGDDSRA